MLSLFCARAAAEDWPTWRHDASRSAASPQELPRDLHLQWTRDYPPLVPAWPDEPRMLFDSAYEPVVLGDTMFVGSSANDSLTALDTRTGQEKWRFFADGPVRFAPVAWRGRVYFVSDDGGLYCLDAAGGKLLWRFSGGPAARAVERGGVERRAQEAGDAPRPTLHAPPPHAPRATINPAADPGRRELVGRRVLGNGRLVSVWPARGGPVLVEETRSAGSAVERESVERRALSVERRAQETGDAPRSTLHAPPPDAPRSTLHAPRATIYFSAGIWPFEGVFLHALDAETGKVLWTNDSCGSTYTMQPHDSPAFAGIAPQGYLAALGQKLLVPNGRAVPACFDRGTGKFLYYNLAAQGKRGGSSVAAIGDFFFNASSVFHLPTGKLLAEVGHEPILTPDAIYATRGNLIQPYRLSRARLVPVLDTWDRPVRDKLGKPVVRLDMPRGRAFAPGGEAHLLAGRRLFITEQNTVKALDLPDWGGTPKVSWEADLDGQPWTLLAADGRLFVVTVEGRIHCFGGEQAEPIHYPLPTPQAPAAEDEWTRAAGEILERTQVAEGYCVLLGIGTGRLAEELARQSKLHIIAVDPDAVKVRALRARLDAAGLYGTRVAAIAIEREGEERKALSVERKAQEAKDAPRSTLHAPLSALPPYLASLLVSEDLAGDWGPLASDDNPQSAPANPQPLSSSPPTPNPQPPSASWRAFARRAFELLRPYGGVACLAVPAQQQEAFRQGVREAELRYADVRQAGELTLLTRVGALPGSADWTHQHADAANTGVSRDTLVKAPLGLLWFGGSSNKGSLPRHGHGPSEQVVGGRLFLEGTDWLRAMDVYTGRLLWQVSLPQVGAPYDNTLHQPGANAIGSNFVSARDGIYVAHGQKCLRLDPATGRTLAEFTFPAQGGKPPAWGYLGVWNDILIAGASPTTYDADVEFTRDEFLPIRDTKVEPLVAWVKRWRDFDWVPRGRGDRPLDFAVNNLNKLLSDPCVLAKLPRDTKRSREVEGIQKLIAWHLGMRDDEAGPDPELRRLNRKLLQKCSALLPRKLLSPGAPYAYSGTTSQYLVALDRHTGKVLWSCEAVSGFLHNAIAVGSGKVFCIDRPPEGLLLAMKRRGKTVSWPPAELLAIDARWGTLRWRTDKDVFGTWLAYSEDHDILVQAGRPSRDMLFEPAKRLMALRGKDGQVLWDKPHRYEGPLLVHGETLISQGELVTRPGKAFSLLTGAELKRRHPLTGAEIPWRVVRQYGCGTAVASEHLLTFRSAAAGYYDLARDGGTGNLGGFRSGCTSNLIPADGVLNAPEYTRSCTCSYPNQTSLALVHRPDVEMWTFNAFELGSDPIRRVGINLGAPGDRMAGDGTLWLDYPSVGGPSPDPHIRVEQEEPNWFRHHASWILAEDVPRDASRVPGEEDARIPALVTRHAARGTLNWVAASGAKGLRSVTVTLAGSPWWWPTPVGSGAWLSALLQGTPAVRTYTVRLHFVEPDDAGPGQRLFDVALQGRRVLKDFDIAREAGGPRRALVREFRGVRVGGDLVITLTPSLSAAIRQPVLCGLQAVAEGW